MRCTFGPGRRNHDVHNDSNPPDWREHWDPKELWIDVFFFLENSTEAMVWYDFFFVKNIMSHAVSYIIIIFIYFLVSVRFPKFCRPSPSQKISANWFYPWGGSPNKKVEVSASATNFSWLFPPGFVGSPQSLGFSTPRNCAFETFGRKKHITSQLGETWEFWSWGLDFIGVSRNDATLILSPSTCIYIYIEAAPVGLLNQMLTVSRPIRPSFTQTFFGGKRDNCMLLHGNSLENYPETPQMQRSCTKRAA